MAAYCLGSAFSPASRTIGIVEGGLKTLQLPSAPQKVEAEDAVFGGLKLLLPLYGWQDRILPATFDASSLEDIGTLCIINPTRNLSAAQQKAVETFIRNGGSLLALGDHTDIGGIRGPLNSLLAFTSIRFNYDSAIPLDQNWKWINSLRAAPHPAFGRRDNSTLGILIGASLTCGRSARVLVVGDRSFSDSGRPWYGVSHLGNMSYDPGERLGGLPLVAEERVGRGLVQVWGDTSGFQDTSLTETHTFLAALFRNLQNYRPWPVKRIYLALGYLIAALLGILLLSRHPGALFASALIGALLFTVWTNHGIDQSPWPDLHGQAAVLDNSHLPQYPQTTPESPLSWVAVPTP